MNIHQLADVQSKNIGEGTSIWQFAVVLSGARIGKNCNINCHTFIENDVTIGDNVTIKSGVYIWDAISIESDVFIGPGVVFTNDLRPRSKQRVPYVKTSIEQGASLGAQTTVLAGVTIGKFAMTGIASVVTKDVPAHALVYGNPARIHGWVNRFGEKMKQVDESTFLDSDGVKYKVTNNRLVAQ